MENTNNEMVKAESKFIIESESGRYIFTAENHDKLNINVVNFKFPEIASLLNEAGKQVKVHSARGEGFKMEMEAVDVNFEYGVYAQFNESIKLKKIENGEIVGVKHFTPVTFRLESDKNINKVESNQVSFSCVNGGEYTVEFEIKLQPNTKITFEIFVEDCIIIDGDKQIHLSTNKTSKSLKH